MSPREAPALGAGPVGRGVEGGGRKSGTSFPGESNPGIVNHFFQLEMGFECSVGVVEGRRSGRRGAIESSGPDRGPEILRGPVETSRPGVEPCSSCPGARGMRARQARGCGRIAEVGIGGPSPWPGRDRVARALLGFSLGASSRCGGKVEAEPVVVGSEGPVRRAPPPARAQAAKPGQAV